MPQPSIARGRDRVDGEDQPERLVAPCVVHGGEELRGGEVDRADQRDLAPPAAGRDRDRGQDRRPGRGAGDRAHQRQGDGDGDRPAAAGRRRGRTRPAPSATSSTHQSVGPVGLDARPTGSHTERAEDEHEQPAARRGPTAAAAAGTPRVRVGPRRKARRRAPARRRSGRGRRRRPLLWSAAGPAARPMCGAGAVGQAGGHDQRRRTHQEVRRVHRRRRRQLRLPARDG